MTEATDVRRGTHRRRWLYVLAIFVVILIVGVAVLAWMPVRQTHEAPVLSYSTVDESTLYAYVETGPGDDFADAYAEETATTVTLHVLERRQSGAFSGPGLMAGERIRLSAPLGDRAVLTSAGDQLREHPYEPMPTIDQIATWADSGQVGPPPVSVKGTVEGTVLLYGGPMKQNGQGAINGEPARDFPFQIRNDSGELMNFTTASRGLFSLNLPVGDYSLVCGPEVPFNVRAEQTTTVTCKAPVP